MIINSGTVSRSFASQNEFSFSAQITNENVFGCSFIGFSGNTNKLNFLTFSGGKIIDFNQREVWAYNPNEITNLSGNIGKTYINYYINNSPVCLYSPLTGAYSGHYYNNIFLTSNGYSTSELSAQIFGDTPNFELSLTQPTVNYLSTDKIEFDIKNLNLDKNKTFRVFSGDLLPSSLPYYVSGFKNSYRISGGQTGQILITGDPFVFVTGDTPVTLGLILQTNFGEITGSFDLNILKAPIYYTDFITGTANESFELRSVYPTERDFYFSLRYVSGYTGVYSGDVFYTGKSSSNLSGFIHGTDYITGYKTISGFYVDQQGTSRYEVVTVPDRRKVPANGTIKYIYSLPVNSTNRYPYYVPDAVIPAYGYFYDSIPLEEKFLLGKGASKFEISGTGLLTGYYKDFLNYNPNSKITTSIQPYFTGFYKIDDQVLLWSNAMVSGKNGKIKSSQNIFFTGHDYSLEYSSFNTSPYLLGVISNTYLLTKNFIYGEDLIIANLSSEVKNFSKSDNIIIEDYNLPNIFQNNQNISFLESGTGYLGCKLLKSAPVTHYGISCHLYSLYSPHIFKLKGSNDNINWIELDSRSGENFYPTGTRYFKSKNTGNYSFYQFDFISGKEWSHYEASKDLFLKDSSGKVLDRLGLNNITLFSGFDLVSPVISDPFPLVYTGLSGEIISSTGNNFGYPDFITPGRIIFSKQSTGDGGFIWKVFKKPDPTDTTFSQIFPNENGEEFIGFEPYGILPSPRSFYLEFYSGSVPPRKAEIVIQYQGVDGSNQIYSQEIAVTGHFMSGSIDIAPSLISNIIMGFNLVEPLPQRIPNFISGRYISTDKFPFTLPREESFDVSESGKIVGIEYFSLNQDILNDNRSYEEPSLYFGKSIGVSDNGKFLIITNNDIANNNTQKLWLYDYDGNAFIQKSSIPANLSNLYNSNFNYSELISIDSTGSNFCTLAKQKNGYSGILSVYSKNYSGIIQSGMSEYPYYKFNESITGNYFEGPIESCFSGGMYIVGAPNYPGGGGVHLIGVNGNLISKNLYLMQTLTSNGSAPSGFGYSFDISDDYKTLVIGSPYDSETSGGAIFIYTGVPYQKNYSLLTKISPSGLNKFTGSGIEFGKSVSIHSNGDLIAVGCSKFKDPAWSGTSGYISIYTGYCPLTGSDGRTVTGSLYNINDWAFSQNLFIQSTGEFYNKASNLGNNIYGISLDYKKIYAETNSLPLTFSGPGLLKNPDVSSYWRSGQLEGDVPELPSWDNISTINLIYFNQNSLLTYSGIKFIPDDLNKMFLFGVYKQNYSGAGKISFFERTV